MQTDDFKKVLAKFPNAKIIDIEEVERGRCSGCNNDRR